MDHLDSARPISATAPLFVILNVGSGHGNAREVHDIIGRHLADAGREHRIHVVDDPAKLRDIAREWVGEACARQGVIVVVGGDGTLNTVAGEALRRGCPLGVLPQGTFNYFGRAHGIPLDTVAALRVLLSARAHPVQVGLVNDRVFLVNASLGLYPQILEDREAYKQRFGRRRSVAAWAALMTLLREHRQLKLRIEHRGKLHEIRTPTLFVANNRLQLEQVGLPEAPLLESDLLVALVLKPVTTPALFGLLLRGALGRLSEADSVFHFLFERITVAPALSYGSRQIKVATDGEVDWLRSPLVFRAAPQRLYLIKPDAAPSEA